MELRCPACASLIPAEDVDLASGWAKCRECSNVFAFRPAAKEVPRPRLPVPMPDKIETSETDGRLVLSRRWRSLGHIFLIPFSIAWWGFLIVWYGMGVGLSAFAEGGWIPGIVMAVFGLPFVAAGVFMVYYAAAGMLNRTIVTVTAERVEVRHVPIKWRGEGSYETKQLTQLYCERHEHRGKHGVSYSYSVNAVTVERRKIVLLSGLDTPDQARFIEDRIESTLGIQDRPVDGEMAR